MVERVVVLPHDATLLDACEMFILHRLLALPITDLAGKILGIVDVDQYTEEIQHLDDRQQSEEIFQLIGVRVAEVRKASLPSLFGNRFPWLLCNIAGGLACAVIAGLFQDVLDRVVVLALFIPVVLALAESVSIQSLTLVLQRQHGRPASWDAILKNLLRELPVGLMLGAACGVFVGGFAWIWKGDADTAICILTSIAAAVMMAAVFGMTVPLLLHKLQRDPKVAAGPITLAMTDVVALTLYLGHGSWSLL
jgi:magnesium transporter